MNKEIEELILKYSKLRNDCHDLIDKIGNDYRLEDKKNNMLGCIRCYTTIIDDLNNLLDKND